MTEWEYSVAVSILTVGGALGSAMAGWAADNWGRKRVLLLAAVTWTVSGLMIATASWVQAIIVARFLCGLASGWTIVVVPMYLTEISPLPWRGVLGILNQLGIVVGIFLAQLAGWHFSTFTEWRSIFKVSIGLGVAQLLLLFNCFESPRFQAAKAGGWDAARRNLQLLRGHSQVEDEMSTWKHEVDFDDADSISESSSDDQRTIQRSLYVSAHDKQVPNSVWGLLWDRNFRLQVRLCLFIMWLQQCSGINAVMFYSTHFFYNLSGDEQQAKKMTLGVSLLNMLMTLVAVYYVEKKGRRPLLLASLLGMQLGALLLIAATAWNAPVTVALLGVCVFVAFFAIGLGPIPFVLVGELFPFEVLGKATAMSLLSNWVWNGLVALVFPSLNDLLHGYVFLIFLVIVIIGTFFAYKYVPETKNKHVDEVVSDMRRRD
jgi:MFS family permease